MQNAPTLDSKARKEDEGLESNSTPTRRRIFLIVCVAVMVAGVVAAIVTRFDWTDLHRKLLGFDPVTCVVLMAALPLLGFSIAAVYVIVGAKFGVGYGLLIITVLTAFHLAVSHLIARTFLKAPLQRMLDRRKKRLPPLPVEENAAVAVLLALVPGFPYFVRNYMLALSGIPLRIYFWICLPIYVLRSFVTLSLGDLSGQLTRHKLIVLATVYAVKLIVCAFLLYRVRRRLKAANVQVHNAETLPSAGSNPKM